MIIVGSIEGPCWTHSDPILGPFGEHRWPQGAHWWQGGLKEAAMFPYDHWTQRPQFNSSNSLSVRLSINIFINICYTKYPILPMGILTPPLHTSFFQWKPNILVTQDPLKNPGLYPSGKKVRLREKSKGRKKKKKIFPLKIVVTMFAWHLHKQWSLCLTGISITHQGSACTQLGPIISVNSQQGKKERNYVQFNGHFVALVHTLRSDQNNAQYSGHFITLVHALCSDQKNINKNNGHCASSAHSAHTPLGPKCVLGLKKTCLM